MKKNIIKSNIQQERERERTKIVSNSLMIFFRKKRNLFCFFTKITRAFVNESTIKQAKKVLKLEAKIEVK